MQTFQHSFSYFNHIYITVESVGMVIAGFVTRVAPTVWLWKLKALFFTHCPVACSISICGLIDGENLMLRQAFHTEGKKLENCYTIIVRFHNLMQVRYTYILQLCNRILHLPTKRRCTWQSCLYNVDNFAPALYTCILLTQRTISQELLKMVLHESACRVRGQAKHCSIIVPSILAQLNWSQVICICLNDLESVTVDREITRNP